MCAVTHGANALHHITAIPWAEKAPPRAGSCLAMEGDSDPHGLNVVPVEAPAGRPFTPWDGSAVGAGHQIAPSLISQTRTERWWR